MHETDERTMRDDGALRPSGRAARIEDQRRVILGDVCGRKRGEIAVRIARTARRMGLGTVGIYAEPDANALHVDSVDVAVALGGSSPAEFLHRQR